MKTIIFLLLSHILCAQNPSIDSLLNTRIDKIEQQSNLGRLFEAISRNYQINVNVDPEISQNQENFRFYNVKLLDILNYVKKRFDLETEFSGVIIRLKKKPEKAKEPVKDPEPDITYLKNKLSLNLKNESLERFVQFLGKKSGKSVLLDPYARTGKISGILQNVPFDQGLRQILEMNGYRLKKDKNIYKIYHFYTTTKTNDPKSKQIRKGIFVDYSDSLTSIDIINGELSFVINDIVRKADVEAVFYSELKGTVNAKFSSASIDDIFLRLFRNSNYTYKKQANIYYFGEKTIKDLISQEVIKLKYLRAGEGQSSSYSNRSTLGGRSSGLSQPQILNSGRQNQLINQPGRIANQRRSSGNNRQRSISRTSNANAGFSADALFEELSKHNINATPLLEQNAVLVTGTKQDIDDAKSIIRLIDRPIPQVLLETILIDINNRAGLNKEISARRGAFPDSLNKSGTSYLPFAMLFNAKDLTPIAEKVGSFLGAKRFGVLPDDFFAFIQINEQKSNIKIKGKYQLATINGHEAFLSVGETRFFKIKDGSILPGNNNNNNTNINFKERFEKLEITNTIRIKPWVNRDGDVTVEIYPQLQTPKKSEGGTPPTISFRELESTVRLKNGETIILGGIIEEEHSDITRDYFPLLSWIPWIGDLFISRGKSDIKRELLIYITPKVYMGDQSEVNIDPSDFK